MAGSKAQRLEKHKKLHPNDKVAAKASGALTKKSPPKQKRWTRELKAFAQQAVQTGYKGTAVLYEWARGDIFGGRRLTDEKAIAHEKARLQERAKDQEERAKRQEKIRSEKAKEGKDAKGKPKAK